MLINRMTKRLDVKKTPENDRTLAAQSSGLTGLAGKKNSAYFFLSIMGYNFA
jgi:hypothetical protein